MNYTLGDYTLRRPEPSDVPALYAQKNDPAIGHMLGGFHMGMSRADLTDWVERHRAHRNEALFVIARTATDEAVGHVGLYDIDFRARSAEFAILLGDRSTWGQGLGRRCTHWAVDYGFTQLNLNRVQLEVLEDNERAQTLYRSLGFVDEGRRRQAQFKSGRHLDVLVMSILASEWSPSLPDSRALPPGT